MRSESAVFRDTFKGRTLLAVLVAASGCSSSPGAPSSGRGGAANGGSAGSSGAPAANATGGMLPAVGGTGPFGGVGPMGNAAASNGAAGNRSSDGGSSPNGGVASGNNAGSGNATGGSSTGGVTSVGGASGGTGGATGSSGAVAGQGGRSGGGGAGGAKASGGAGAGNVAGASSCGAATPNLHPFGCKFAWGIADPGGNSYSQYDYVSLMSYWVDSNISASGSFSECHGCTWLGALKNTNIIPAYYGYVIGFLGHANGIVDGNQTGAKNLTNSGTALIRAHRQQIVDAYAWYAKKSYEVWKDKPLLWLLEGDFVQYTYADQVDETGKSTALSFAELGALAADITCAIKSNMPNAVVGIDHSTWISDELTNSYWGALKAVNYDFVWTTGVGNNKGFLEASTTSATYNAKTATYAYLKNLTGRTILVDTSAGASAAGDSWSSASAEDLNARIAEGVIAANITGTAPTNLKSNLASLAPKLSGIPSCP